MECLFAFDDEEVLDEVAIGEHSLGADSGAAAGDVGGLDFGDEALQRGAEELEAEGAADLVAGHGRVADEEAPETGKRERVPQVRDRDVRPAVAFAGEGEDRVGAGLDAAVDKAGEVDAEEREGGVGDGVNEMIDEELAGGFEEIVFAAEGDDAGVAAFPGEGGDAVAVEAGAVDEEIGLVLAVEDPAWFDFGDGGARENLGAGAPQEGDHGVADVLVVDNSFFGDAEGEEAGGVGFDFADLFGGKEAEAAEAVLLAAGVEVVEAGEFGGVGGDDEFAADFVADGVLLTEGEHLADAVDGEAGFGGAGFVIEAGVEDSGVVAGLMAADDGFLLKDGDLGVGEAVLESEGGG